MPVLVMFSRHRVPLDFFRHRSLRFSKKVQLLVVLKKGLLNWLKLLPYLRVTKTFKRTRFLLSLDYMKNLTSFGFADL